MPMLKTSLITRTDSYKGSHYLQYPEDTAYISSYIEARSGWSPFMVQAGLQMLIKMYLCDPITMADIDEGDSIFTPHMGVYNRKGWLDMLNKHGGLPPISIYALPEGTVLPHGNALTQVVNNDPEFAWLGPYFETSILRANWFMSTVATTSWHLKQIIKASLERTSETPDAVLPFRLHDFGARGASSSESAAIGGIGHLISFLGTDTVEALVAARQFYGENMAGYSIPAYQHGTVTSWGRNGEAACFRNALKVFGGPGKMFAFVGDSYDIFNFVGNIVGKECRQEVLDSQGTVVIRPDSGDPQEVVPEVLRLLARDFGATKNSKGFFVLNKAVRVIQGDGMNPRSIEQLLNKLEELMWSTENIAFGMGGALLQKVTRDDFSFAMKDSAMKPKNGLWQDVYKDPVTDPGKRSKRGRQAVIVDQDGVFRTVREEFCGVRDNRMVEVYRNGKLLVDWSLSEIRARSNVIPKLSAVEAAA